MTESKIEWCDRSDWNPIRGCTRVSPGCVNCYAERIAARVSDPGQPFHGIAERTASGPRWTGQVMLAEDRLDLPLRWRKPARIFVNSMYDLFHEAVPDDWIDRVFAVMALAPQHTFIVLTKRAERMRDYFSAPLKRCSAWIMADTFRRVANRKVRWKCPLPNVWLGVSVEDQARADERIPHLLETPAAVRFISAEPLLGPIDLSAVGEWTTQDALRGFLWSTAQARGPRLHWVIAGGESGPGARPMHPDWARSLRDQCAAAGVPYFFKQWGAWHPDALAYTEVGTGVCPPPKMMIGKAAAGRLLDGREHSEFPA